MKARLRLPLRTTIRDGFDKGDVMRIWRGVRARRPRQRRVLWLAFGLAAVASAALGLSFPRLARHDHAGPLHLASGSLPSKLVAEQEPQRLALADGSIIGAAPHTKLDVLANDAKLFLTALRQGAVRIHVPPGGPRRWVIECGPVSIEIVGTELEVERAAGEIVVSVVRGVVVVRGAQVPDHVQRLTAGNRLAIPMDEAPSPKLAIPAAPGAMTQAAPDLAPPPGTPTTTSRSDAEDLIRRADAARRLGDLGQAKRLLAQAIETSQGASAAALAALTLARLTMKDDPAGAARVLARALAAGVPRGLEEDAQARLVEARARSGDRQGAHQAAEEYRRRFPQGVRHQEVQRWVGE